MVYAVHDVRKAEYLYAEEIVLFHGQVDWLVLCSFRYNLPCLSWNSLSYKDPLSEFAVSLDPVTSGGFGSCSC